MRETVVVILLPRIVLYIYARPGLHMLGLLTPTGSRSMHDTLVYNTGRVFSSPDRVYIHFRICEFTNKSTHYK